MKIKYLFIINLCFLLQLNQGQSTIFINSSEEVAERSLTDVPLQPDCLSDEMLKEAEHSEDMPPNRDDTQQTYQNEASPIYYPVAAPNMNTNYYVPYNESWSTRRYRALNYYVRHIEGKGIGYKHGYTGLGIIWTPFVSSCFQPLYNVEYAIFNNGKSVANVGIGGRFINRSLDKVFGINVFYDYRQDEVNLQQVGVGLEMLGCQFDLRANGYIPVGRQTRKRKLDTIFYDEGFFAEHRHIRKSYGGFDAEIETSLTKFWPGCIDWDPYIAVGGYYFTTRHRQQGHHLNHIRGGLVRGGVWYLDFIDFEVRAYFDNVNHTLVQGAVSFYFPIYKSYCCCPCQENCCDYLSCLAIQPIYRNGIIVAESECRFKTNFCCKK